MYFETERLLLLFFHNKNVITFVFCTLSNRKLFPINQNIYEFELRLWWLMKRKPVIRLNTGNKQVTTN